MKEEEGETENENENGQIKSEENLVSNNDLIEINESKRTVIFICLVIVATLSSCDGGIIPQQNIKINDDFDTNGEHQVGLFGSIDYIGRVIGAIIFTIIMGKMNRKMMLVVTLIFKGITLFIPIFTINYYINIVARCLSGLSQVFYPTYLPVWCDQYGKKSSRAIMVMVVQIGNPIGIILGYGLSMVCQWIELFGMNGWRTSFAIEGIILIVCAVFIVFFDDIYFSEKLVLVDDSKGKIETKSNENESNLIGNVCKIICNKIFLFSSICNSVAFFGIGVVQFFGDKYMEVVLEIDSSIRFIFFGLLCLLGPTCGMVFGGIICSKLGGYTKKNSMTFIIISMALASIISMFIACHTNIVLFIIAAWTYLFAIGAVIPPISGLIISCLDNNLRGDGFSICNFLNNLIGNFLSSYVYSLIVDAFALENKEEDAKYTDKYRYAWMISMGYNFVGLLFVIIAGIFRYRIEGDLSDNPTNEEKDEKEEEEEKEKDENKENDDNENDRNEV